MNKNKKIFSIVLFPNQCLKTLIEHEVQELNDSANEIIDIMIKTLHATNGKGIGLAAPQVGILERIIIININCEKNKEDLKVMINPILIVDSSTEQIISEESCLSIPVYSGKVKRYSKISVEYMDHNLEQQELETDGSLSRVIQHEVDHLDGILFIDKLEGGSFKKKLTFDKIKKRMKKFNRMIKQRK